MKLTRTAIFFIVTLLLVTTLTGCGGNNAGKTGQAPEQILKVAIGTDINTWDIVQFPDGDARFVWSQIYETLVRLDEDLHLVPGLAESWDSADGGKTWTFHLKEGVKFHDGTDFDAQAVLFSYDKRGYVVEAKTLQLEGIEALDAHTVRFICAKPMPLPTYLTHIAWPVVSPTSIDASGNFTKPIGTGPFQLAQYNKGQEVILERNPNYWGEQQKLDQVIFKIIPDATTRMMALTSGDVDMSIKVPESEVSRLEKDPNLTVHKKTTTFTDFMQFNCTKAPFDDLHVRKAVAYAIDTEGIVKNILQGIGEAARGRPYAPVMMYSSPDLPLYSQDLEQAKKLLAEAGWQDSNNDGVVEKDGQPLTIDLVLTPSWGSRQQKIAEACQAQLAQAGFNARVNQLEGAAAEQAEREGNFDIIMRTGFFVWGPYPHHVKIHHSKNYKSHYSNPEYDALVNKGESEIDEQVKQQTYTAIQKMILEELPAFYLVHEQKIIATRNTVQGYRITAEDPWLNLQGIEIVQK
ncbi:ABC transporter substrate-binding protein [Desulfoscipio sp. XC116]|uniref:ABC transporter substrate-binding protein n=1 Tax=Desulfoscipio sp. XC116 TaxID=3144975 RepID=UPI00325A9249